MADRLANAGVKYTTDRVKGAATGWGVDALAQKFPETLGYQAATVDPVSGAQIPATSSLAQGLGVAGGLGGAYGLYQLGKQGWGQGIKDWKTNALRTGAGYLGGAALGSGIASGAALAGIGTYAGTMAALGPIGIAAAVAVLATGMMKAGKSKEQSFRDASRSILQDAGIADKDYNVTLANGAKAYIGGDGQTTAVGKDGKTYKQGYESDWSNPLTGESVQYAELINAITSGPRNEGKSDKGAVTANLMNAMVTGANTKEDVGANFKSILGGSKISGRNAWRQVGDLVNSKQISADQGTIYHNALKNIYGQEYEKWGADAGEDTMGPVAAAPAPAATVNRNPAKSRLKKPSSGSYRPPTSVLPPPTVAPTILPGPNALMTMPQAMTPEQEAEALARVSAQNQRRM